MLPRMSRRARHVLSGMVCVAVLGGCASSDGPPQVRDASGSGFTPPPQLDSPDENDDAPKSPLLPSAFFADGAEAFVSWRCTPAQDLISVAPGNSLRLWSAQGYYALERSVVADGKRYRKGTLTFAQQGDEAHVESDNGQLACQQDARRESITRDDAPDVIFKGQGNEPGWTLELDREAPQLTLMTQYGEEKRTLDYRVTQLDNGHQAAMTLESGDADAPVTVELKARACFDSMSGKPYPVQVRVEEAGRTWVGCGQGIERTR
ncbi:C-type lysozyme, inhibitor [Chromohalobacter nigrandesensis]|uniref:C-type lysozyme, inhibitor n=1 Tax=Chromohalobacter nigrandesensis TaxID=119863 RepID=UPI001FF3C5D4|nr:C-type lysozyme, inhibitor [Chromohalobacter nigrandesensis]MCK0745303.1 C-type lysozyme, inhibitor [Chromohalobacter nigrandesensis]